MASLRALESALRSVAAGRTRHRRISLETFSTLLNLALQDASVHADGNERGGVRVLNFYDLRGLRFRRLAIGGLAEAFCPAPAAPTAARQRRGNGAAQALAARLNDTRPA